MGLWEITGCPSSVTVSDAKLLSLVRNLVLDEFPKARRILLTYHTNTDIDDIVIDY